MATFGDWKTAENDLNTTKYGCFFNQNDAQRPESVSKCRFEIQYGDFRFLNNSGKRPNNTHYGYFRDCYDAMKLRIDLR